MDVILLYNGIVFIFLAGEALAHKMIKKLEDTFEMEADGDPEALQELSRPQFIGFFIIYSIDKVILAVKTTAAQQATMEEARQIVPGATKKAYEGKQAEFLAWAEIQAYENKTSHIVTGDKVLLFLRETVIGRTARAGKNKGSRVSAATIKQYLSALVSLWKQQRAMNCNSNQNPRDNELIRELLTTEMKSQFEISRQSLQPRHQHSFLDGLVCDGQLVQISDKLFAKGSDLKHRLAALLSHSAALRGQSTRLLELADLALIELKREGPMECHALVLLLRQGKTNKFGKREYGAAMRNSTVEICAVGAMAFSFFQRWHVDNEPAPDFSENVAWHFVKLIPGSKTGRRGRPKKASKRLTEKEFEDIGVSEHEELEEVDGDEEIEDNEEESEEEKKESADKDNEARQTPSTLSSRLLTSEEVAAYEAANPPIRYEAQRKVLARVLKELNIVSTTKTHFFRHSSARAAELAGVPEDEIRRHGRWNNQCLEGVYLAPFPRKAMRALAGFNPERPCFFIARGGVSPPVELTQNIFPWIEEWEAKLPVEQRPIHLFKLLKYLRVVLLQDAAVLMTTGKHKDNPIFRHALFKSEQFTTFRRDLNSFMSSAEARRHDFGGIEDVAPLINDALQAIQSNLSGSLNLIGERLDGLTVRLNNLGRENSVPVQSPLCAGTITLISQLLCQVATRGVVAEELQGQLLAALTDHSPADAPSTTSQAPPTRKTKASPTVTGYSQSRKLLSVIDIWDEYANGLNGGRSIKSLEAEYGSAWRDDEKNRKFFYGQKVIYSAVEELSSQLNITCQAAARRIEAKRVNASLTINELRHRLKSDGIDFILDKGQ